MGKKDRALAERLGPLRDGKRIPWFTLERLLEIYHIVGSNSLACPDGCHECCKKGTEVSELEQMLIEAYCFYKGYAVHTKGTIVGRCPYVTDIGTCHIYPVRPLMCRIFGIADKDFMCPIGIQPVHPAFSSLAMSNLFKEGCVQYSGKILKKPAPEELRLAMMRLVLVEKVSYGKEAS